MSRVWPLLVLVALLTGQPTPVFAQFQVKEKPPIKLASPGLPKEPHLPYAVLTSDGLTLAYYADQQITFWDLTTGKQKSILKTPSLRELTCVTLNSDGTVLATAASGIQGIRPDNRIVLWDLATKRQTAVLRVGDTVPKLLAFSPDGKTLASQGGKEYVRLWEVQTGKERANLPTEYEGRFLAFSPNGKQLVIGGDSHTYFWNLEMEGAPSSLLDGGYVTRGHTAFSPDSRQVAVVTLTGARNEVRQVQVLNAETRKAKHTLKTEGWTVLAFSRNGKVLAVGKENGVELVAVETGETHTLEGVGAPLVFSPDGKTLTAVVTAKGKPTEVKVWELTWEKEPGK